jgi:hypothetical protein
MFRKQGEGRHDSPGRVVAEDRVAGSGRDVLVEHRVVAGPGGHGPHLVAAGGPDDDVAVLASSDEEVARRPAQRGQRLAEADPVLGVDRRGLTVPGSAIACRPGVRSEMCTTGARTSAAAAPP